MISWHEEILFSHGIRRWIILGSVNLNCHSIDASIRSLCVFQYFPIIVDSKMGAHFRQYLPAFWSSTLCLFIHYRYPDAKVNPPKSLESSGIRWNYVCVRFESNYVLSENVSRPVYRAWAHSIRFFPLWHLQAVAPFRIASFFELHFFPILYYLPSCLRRRRRRMISWFTLTVSSNVYPQQQHRHRAAEAHIPSTCVCVCQSIRCHFRVLT